MKNIFARTFLALLTIAAGTNFAPAQERSNASTYGATQQQRPRVVATGVLAGFDAAGYTPTYFLEAVVLMNLKADEYNVSLGVAQEGKTAQESEQKVDALLGQLTNTLGNLGIKTSDTFVDFISQNPIYEFAAASSGRTATEKQVGFQTKKNIIVRYTDRALLRRITNAASGLGIYDVIKINYVVKDLTGMRSRMMAEATKIIKQKEQNFQVLNIKMRPVAVVEERYQTFNPDALYQSYTAYESGAAEGYRRVVEKRKSSTSYYDPLDPNDFDTAINAIGIEPVVQSTLYLKVKYLPTDAATTPK